MKKGLCTHFFVFSLVTLETRGRTLVTDDRVLDQSSIIGGNHYSLGRLSLDWQGCLAMGLDQSVNWEALGLHRDPLCVHLRIIKNR